MIRFWLAISLFYCANAFAKIVPNAENVTTAKGVVSIWGAWIEDDGDKFDVNVHIRNEDPDKGIIVYLKDMRCKRGARGGELKYTFFNTGERTIDLKGGEEKNFNMVCRYQVDEKGDFEFSVSRVYENRWSDGKTVGAVIAKDLVWKHPYTK